MSERTGLLIQVRLASTRFPQKALKEVGGVPSIQRAMQFLSPLQSLAKEVEIKALIYPEKDDDVLRPLAERMGFDVFKGSPDNLLQRYLNAGQHFNLTNIIRATGDNPFTCPLLASNCLRTHIEQKNDLTAYSEIPLGSGVEVLRLDALSSAFAETSDPYDLEHATPFLHKNPTRFRLQYLPPPPEFHYPKMRLTLDTQEDCTRLNRLYDHLFAENRPDPTFTEVVDLYKRLAEKESSFPL